MKNRIYYQVEYRLVSAKGINRGEIGGYTCTRKFSEYELDDAIIFVNKYKCYRCDNIYDKKSKSLSNRDVPDDDQLYHIQSPKIWHMNLRADLRHMKQREEMFGKKPKWKDWTHIDGDVYNITFEMFNLKTRLMEYANYECATLEEAFKNTKLKDTKTRLVSDWTLYSKHLYKP